MGRHDDQARNQGWVWGILHLIKFEWPKVLVTEIALEVGGGAGAGAELPREYVKEDFTSLAHHAVHLMDWAPHTIGHMSLMLEIQQMSFKRHWGIGVMTLSYKGPTWAGPCAQSPCLAPWGPTLWFPIAQYLRPRASMLGALYAGKDFLQFYLRGFHLNAIFSLATE